YDKSVDGALRRIIGMGDVLGGKRIDSMDFTRMGRSGDDLIFWFKQNGPEPTYQAIYTVHIAAPGSILLVAGAGVTAVRRRRAGV
ncbi:MAG: hypothetical protein JNM07_09990, partial [Phycisphaerae bacterium]|nr:hypothetical protein [Phycisphaerae bacterium]